DRLAVRPGEGRDHEAADLRAVLRRELLQEAARLFGRERLRGARAAVHPVQLRVPRDLHPRGQVVLDDRQAQEHPLTPQHGQLRDRSAGAEWWVLPGGRREPGETFAAAGRREVFEETGIRVRRLRRVQPPGDAAHVTYALFVADQVEDGPATPTVDLGHEGLL